MKRIILSTLPLLIISNLFGQGYRSGGQALKIGVYADPMISWFAPESRTVHSEGTVIGIDGGLMLNKYFQKNYAVETGISIGTQGGSLLFDDEVVFTSYDVDDTLDAGTSVDYRLNYITVPVGLKLKTNEIGYFSYFARLGFSNQFNIKAKASSSEGTLNDSDIGDEIFFYNLSYYFGAGIHFNISEDTALLLGVNYINGFINITREDGLKTNTRAVTLRLGVIF